MFLDDFQWRHLDPDSVGELEAEGLLLGPGSAGLEVAITRASSRPHKGALRRVWKGRHGGRAAPVLLVTLYED